MKKIFSLLILLALFCAFTAAPKVSNEEKAMKSIQGFYDAMTAFDYDVIATFCTDDFCAMDGGVYYKNLDGFLTQVKKYEGAKITVGLDLIRSDFDGRHGLVLLKFTADADFQGEKMRITALENYVLEKVKGKWLIEFVHSTPIAPEAYAEQ